MNSSRHPIGISPNKLQTFVPLLIGGIVVVCSSLIGHSIAQASTDRVVVNATRFAFAPTEITLREGKPVDLVMRSVDTAHGIRIRELGIELKAAKGQTSDVTFTPNRTGEFIGHCSVFCGSGHGRMTLVVHVVQ